MYSFFYFRQRSFIRNAKVLTLNKVSALKGGCSMLCTLGFRIKQMEILFYLGSFSLLHLLLSNKQKKSYLHFFFHLTIFKKVPQLHIQSELLLYSVLCTLFDNLTIFQGIVVSVLYCFCSPDVRVVIAKRLYRMKVRWRSRNLRRDNNRRFRESRRVSYFSTLQTPEQTSLLE